MDDVLWVLNTQVGLGIYDFNFESRFPCKHPWQRPTHITAVARIGAIEDYVTAYNEFQTNGIELIHTPEQHFASSELDRWYPLIEDLTPRSHCYEKSPSVADIERDFGWPIFMKGSRQTSRHSRSLSFIDSANSFTAAMARFQEDPVLRWQKVVCREFVRLRPVEDPHPERIPSSFEFRTFWWKGQLVGAGRYWWEGKPYNWTDAEKDRAICVAGEAAARINSTFLVVDVAQASDGRWLIIECNDAQESGYAGASPIGIWQNIISHEKGQGA